jgi:hypothetical protein
MTASAPTIQITHVIRFISILPPNVDSVGFERSENTHQNLVGSCCLCMPMTQLGLNLFGQKYFE